MLSFRTLAPLLTDLRILILDTGRVFWRLLPQLLVIHLIGWLGNQLALKLASIVGEPYPWVGLIIFCTSFLFILGSLVLTLRLCGRELGIWSMVPEDESVGDDRDSSLTRLLAVTLLPFLGLYAAFGKVQEAATRLTNEQVFRLGVLSEIPTVMATVGGLARSEPLHLLGLLVGLYVIRRVLDETHERTNWRPLGISVAFVESVFLMVAIYGGFAIVNRIKNWLFDRVFVEWLDNIGDWWTGLLSAINARLPVFLDAGWTYFTDEVWPLFWEVVSQPIIWLAVAALVFGSQVLSLAELWRKGRPLATKIPGASHFSRHRDKVAYRQNFRVRMGKPPAGAQRVAYEIKEAFFGDIDDKYLPTFHSIRLVLRAGLVFMGSFIFVYTLVAVGTNYVDRGIRAITGGHDADFWFLASPFIQLAEAPLEILRLCLLAVSFRRCLELLQQRGHAESPVTTPAPQITLVGVVTR